ncbi:serine/threonine-protein kinase [Tautonia marina]|uniref:serine/threonine-protein kinase n=1 Tax=Tautonia marina TaxID=2653855 RepID=UPI001260CED7|nr:serine/threonine-protein kinase [Tautonia marina]
MNPSAWKRVDELFAAALERPASERSSFLQEACGADTALLREVEALLEADACANDRAFLGKPLGAEFQASRLDPEPDDSLIGHQIGPYEIEALIGRGGMGSVYRAVRREEFTQVVAIKLIKRGMDTDEILRRFRNEMHVQAALGQHPNIAAILDAGTTADHRPYLVMEWIDGLPVETYCERQGLGIPERLRLFRSICEAVQFAHSVAVIHRDLKPSNILVTPAGVPKLIDFGIAKWLNTEESGRADDPSTMPEHRILTPQYASPEQIEGRPLSTATDVYSLGVVLFELLTGERPYRLTTGRMDELIQAVCEQPPPRPSTVVTQLEHRQTPAAPADGLPRTDPVPFESFGSKRKLARQLSGDLDNIVLMALRKEPERRYASVERFSRDIERHLKGIPVEARPSTLGYRLSRFVRRNRVAVGLAVVMLVLLIGGIVGTTVGMLRARASEAMALRNEDRARRAVEELLVRVTENQLLNAPGLQDLRRELLESALEYYEEFLEDSSDQPALRVNLASTYNRIAKINEMIGRNEEALNADRQALTILEELIRSETADTPESVDRRLDYLHDHATVLNSLGLIERRIGRTEDALSSFERSRDSAQTVVTARPDSAFYLEALANVVNNLALVLVEVGRLDEAIDCHDEAIRLQRSLVEGQSDNLDYQAQLADMLMISSRPAFMIGNDDGALDVLEQSLSLYESIREQDSRNMLDANRYSQALSQYAVIQMYQGKILEARNATGRAIDLLEPLVESNPMVPDYQSDLLYLSNLACELDRREGRIDEAFDSAYVAENIGETLIKSHPDVTEYVSYASKSMNNLGRLFEAQGDRGKALEYYDRATTLLEQIAQADPIHNYNLACNAALAAQVVGDDPEQPTEEDTQARRNRNDRAMNALRRAVDAGYVRMENLEHDSDLDGLRNRPDFQELIESLD